MKTKVFSNLSSVLAINIFIEINKLKPRHKKNLIFSHLKINLFAQSYLLHTEELVKNIFEIFNMLSLIQNSRRDYFSKYRDVFGHRFTNYFSTYICLYIPAPKKR